MSLIEQLKNDLKDAMRAQEVVRRDSIRAINTMIKQVQVDERKELIKKSLPAGVEVEISSFDGLLVDFMKNKNASILIRGLRAVSDYEYELQLALTNDILSKNSIETIFFTASRENLYLSASIVKDIALNGGNLEGFVNDNIVKDIQEKVKKLR